TAPSAARTSAWIARCRSARCRAFAAGADLICVRTARARPAGPRCPTDCAGRAPSTSCASCRAGAIAFPERSGNAADSGRRRRRERAGASAPGLAAPRQRQRAGEQREVAARLGQAEADAATLLGRRLAGAPASGELERVRIERPTAHARVDADPRLVPLPDV